MLQMRQLQAISKYVLRQLEASGPLVTHWARERMDHVRLKAMLGRLYLQLRTTERFRLLER